LIQSHRFSEVLRVIFRYKVNVKGPDDVRKFLPGFGNDAIVHVVAMNVGFRGRKVAKFANIYKFVEVE
jgi:hypothetical protein